MDKAAAALQTFDQIEILKNRIWLKAAGRAIDRRSHENAGVAIAEPEQAKPRVHAREQARGRSAAIEFEREITPDYFGPSERFQDAIGCVRGRSRISVQEPKHIGDSGAGALVHLISAPALTNDGVKTSAAH